MTMDSNIQKSFIDYADPDSTRPFTEHEDLFGNFNKLKHDLITIYDQKVERWFEAMDLYDHDIIAHTVRVTALSLELGRLMGLKYEQLENLQFGTLLHDIGKLGIPNAIIQKPGKITMEEYQVVKKHTVYAYEWIANWDVFHPAKVIPLYHHEKWNGSGYPHQLKGNDIPFLARLVAVVDVWDAITSDRPYRRAMSKTKAIHIIKSESGSHFEPDIVEAFLELNVHRNSTIVYSNALIL
jgi:HD-GYP domain-containing protein (c-di-GMP phosphodiesterase class II)